MKKHLVLALLALAAVFGGCSTNAVTGRKQLSIIPASQLQSLSYAQYSQFLGSNKLSTNQEQTAMIKRVGARIQKAVTAYMAEKGQSSKLDGFKWEFNLVEDKTLNAWCMPGGKVVFYTGILPVCKDESGVAVVMGHEVAHAIANHGGERMSQGLVVQGLGAGLQVALQEKPALTQQLFMQSFNAGSQMGLLKYSRVHESEADEMGIIFSAMAGYDPREAVAFWQRMSAMSGGQAPPEFMSTHPSHETRISQLNALMPKALQIYEQNKGKY